MKNSILLLLSLWLLHTGCQKSLFEEWENAGQAAIFTQIWEDFDQNYGLFAVKNINWDSVYASTFPQISSETSDRQLYDAVTGMLSILNDKHITLFPATNPELPRWSVDLDSQGIYHNDYFDLQEIKDHYLPNLKEPEPFIQFGKLDQRTGYLHIQHLNAGWKSYEKSMDAALNELKDLDGLVLDLRDCAGGYDPIAQYLAGRFCREEQLFMTVRKKNGPGRNDFTEPESYFIRPTGDHQFTKPVVLLTSPITASAGETMTLALKTQSHITQLGEITSGNFSDSPMRESSNGWLYTLSIGDYRDAGGLSLEGIGIQPDLIVETDKIMLQSGRDLVLEKALQILE